MIRKMGFRWNLRQLMAEQGMFATSDLVPLLAERGVHLSREQVYRLVTGVPERLSLDLVMFRCVCKQSSCSWGLAQVGEMAADGSQAVTPGPRSMNTLAAARFPL